MCAGRATVPHEKADAGQVLGRNRQSSHSASEREPSPHSTRSVRRLSAEHGRVGRRHAIHGLKYSRAENAVASPPVHEYGEAARGADTVDPTRHEEE